MNLQKLEKFLEFKKFERINDKLVPEIKSGFVVRTNKDKLYLVGDVNQLLGVCDDCIDFKKDDLVEYALLEHLFNMQLNMFAAHALSGQIAFEGMEGCDKELIVGCAYELAMAMVKQSQNCLVV